MKRVAEYKIVFCIIAGLILALPAMAQSLTGVSTVAEAVSSSEYSLQRLEGLASTVTTKIPSVITNKGITVMNVTIPEEALYDEGVEIISDSPWIVKGVDDPVAEGVADRNEYILSSLFPHGFDNGLELSNILIDTYDSEIATGYLSSVDVMLLPDIYTGKFDDGKVDEFLLRDVGYALWDEVLTQEDKEEYLNITEEFYMAMADEMIFGDGYYRGWRYREIPKSRMNKIFEDNTCWHEWVYNPESTKVQFKLGVDEETFTSDPGFQSLSEEKQEKFLERWQKADADYKEYMFNHDCYEGFADYFCSYVKSSKSIAEGTSHNNGFWTYEYNQLMADIFSRFGADDGYTYVYEYNDDTNEITRYQAELKEKEGHINLRYSYNEETDEFTPHKKLVGSYLLPDNPVLDE